jgi:hypothetical protein
VSVEAIAILVTVLLALTGYAARYVNDLRLAQRKDRLERVNRQLSELYGPLLALHAANERLWQEFRARYRPQGPFWAPADPPGATETDAWRLWMTTVFMPLNREMQNVVVRNADLLRESEGIPSCLLDLCAHVAGYETVAERWRIGKFDPVDMDLNVSVVNYPQVALTAYVEGAFRELKAEQTRLLRGLGLT